MSSICCTGYKMFLVTSWTFESTGWLSVSRSNRWPAMPSNTNRESTQLSLWKHSIIKKLIILRQMWQEMVKLSMCGNISKPCCYALVLVVEIWQLKNIPDSPLSCSCLFSHFSQLLHCLLLLLFGQVSHSELCCAGDLTAVSCSCSGATICGGKQATKELMLP